MATTSIQPRKQRKAMYNAPHHVRSRFLSAPLSDDLQKKYGKRSLRVVKGDTVKVTRGDFKGDEGIVDDVNTKDSTVTVHGVSLTKADGKDVPRPIHASKVIITKLNTTDTKRVTEAGGAE
jgi:large subunit ribosomal protein L24